MMLSRFRSHGFLPHRVLPYRVAAGLRPIVPPLALTRSIATAAPLRPLLFPTRGLDLVDPATKLEEETLSSYVREAYYPMRLGEIINDRYQVVEKFGYGRSSTVWLCRDLLTHEFSTLKVHTLIGGEHDQELKVFKHLAATGEELGKDNVRRLHSSFKLLGPYGEHDVSVLDPLGMSLEKIREINASNVLGLELAIWSIKQCISGLQHLHSAGVVHTDIHPDNLLFSLLDNEFLEILERRSIIYPGPVKVVDEDLTIYSSARMMDPKHRELILGDYGRARIGETHRGVAMRLPFRAPEIILDMPWGSDVDIWNVGTMAWDMLQGKRLFEARSTKTKDESDALHLAEMVALLGPPPPEFLSRSEKTVLYWDKDGNRHGPVPVPTERTFEALARNRDLVGEKREQFLDFMTSALAWLPEERWYLEVLSLHPFLHGLHGDL